MKNLKLSTLNKEGEIAGDVAVSFGTVESKNPGVFLAQAVRVFLSNQRKAHAKAKTRAEVRGSGIKIWKQKGTGRARHGARQAPIFVGGGVVHGPSGTQNYRKKLTEQMKRTAIITALQEKIKDKKAYLIKDLEFKKTKDAFTYLDKVRKTLSIKGEISLLLTPKDETKRYLTNLSETTVLNTESLNSYSLLHNNLLLISETALKNLETRFSVKEENARNN